VQSLVIGDSHDLLGGKTMKDFNMDLQNKFLSRLKELQSKGVSQNAVATQIGVSSSLISQYKSGTYPGDVKEIEDKVKGWLERSESKDKNLVISYVEIKATKSIFKAIETCQRDKDFSVIIGNAGVSKTETCKRYIELNKSGIYIKINQSTRGALLRSIAKQLNISMQGNTITLYEKIIGVLSGRDWVIIVDEADYLKENCKELLRHISDDAGIGVCLVGLPRLEMQLVNATDDYQQLVRRIGTFLDLNKINTYSIDDCKVIMKSVWNNISDDVVKSFFKASKMSIGTLSKLMMKSHEISLEAGFDCPDMSVLDMAKSIVMRASSSMIGVKLW